MSTGAESFGHWLARHRPAIQVVQWLMVGFYLVLLLGPVVPFSGSAVLARWADLVFWGVWWPGVLLSMMVAGQFWCGILCPDGTVSEWTSGHGRGRKPAGWMRHGWLPVALFAVLSLLTDVTNAHGDPWGGLLAVGGASVAAVVVGLIYGRGTRIWCRYLCPMAGLFSLLARCSPLYFQVDRARWDAAVKPLPKPVQCPLLLDVRRLRGTEKCNMCARCSGHRDAVRLAWRMPGAEIAQMKLSEARRWEAVAICFVLLGLAHAGALARGDGLTILAVGLLVGGATATLLLLAAGSRQGAAFLAYALLPLGGAGLFLATLSHTAAIAAGLGLTVPLDILRPPVLAVAALWSGWLGWVLSASIPFRRRNRPLLALLVAALAGFYALAPSWLH